MTVMRRRTYMHLMLGTTHTYCGKPAGFHLPLKATGDPGKANCPRCLASWHRAVASDEARR